TATSAGLDAPPVEKTRAAGGEPLPEPSAPPPDPEAEAQVRRGDALAAVGDVSGATEAYTEALRIAPGFPAAHRKRGLAHVRAREFRRAVNDFVEFLKAQPRHVRAPLNTGPA